MKNFAYLAHKYMDTIRRVEDFTKFQSSNRYWGNTYTACSSYDEAKMVVVNRAEMRIIELEQEIKKIKKKLPKLKSMTEQNDYK